MNTSEFDFGSALKNLGTRVISKAWIRIRCRNRIIRGEGNQLHGIPQERVSVHMQ